MEEDHKKDEQEPIDHFSRLMFGSRKPSKENEHHVQEETFYSSIDIDELMKNIDILIDSSQSLKPIFQKVFPFVKQLWKKG